LRARFKAVRRHNPTVAQAVPEASPQVCLWKRSDSERTEPEGAAAVALRPHWLYPAHELPAL